MLFLLINGRLSLSLLRLECPSSECWGLVYSGGACCVWSGTLNPICVVSPVWLDSPGSSFEGICTRCAREMSVGDRTGPGLVGEIPCLKFPLRVRPWRGSGKWLWLCAPSRPASSRMLPCSLPYGGGGARLPVIGANPHFLTFASMKTKPDCPKLTCTVQGPLAPTAGKRF